MRFFVLAFFFLSLGCSTTTEKNSRRPASSVDFISLVRKVQADLGNPSIYNPASCESYGQQLTEYLFDKDSTHFVPRTPAEKEELLKHGPTLVSDLFQIRLMIRERLRDFESQGEVSPGCLQQMRRAFRYLRFASEFLSEWLIANGVFKVPAGKVLAGPFPATEVNPAFQSANLLPGDLLLMRGKSYISAMIARIGDEEGHFSHLAIVGEDTKGNLYLVEALIQTGSIIHPISHFHDKELARAVVYRHPDRELAKRAARAAWEHVKSYREQRGEAIRYDFAMDDSDASSLYCSELVQLAYRKVTNGSLVLPRYKTTAEELEKVGFLKSMSIRKSKFFAPSDIEFDTRFELVAEHRDFRFLRQNRIQDAVLQSQFTWMKEKGYRYRGNAVYPSLAVLAKLLRQMGLLKEVFPKYMPIETVKTSTWMRVSSGYLEKSLMEIEKNYFSKNGHSLTFKDLLAEVEKLRIEDCQKEEEVWKSSASNEEGKQRVPSQFHWFFRGGSCR
ncbi:MAG: YiiX/YebB-like N1pC/P60 family cysteine hydrolase [Bdellovibrionaceae bacterium]|nr:YiiX/YebB-like N1pC/P60 family cysteine hydrolase [Pseudobdellovibrionaceae bacterium]